MKISLAILITLLLFAGGYFLIASKNVGVEVPKAGIMTGMEIKSLAFENNGRVPAKYTCDGENVNPPLIISDVPEGARSLVLIVDDPDAPAGVWTHWTIWNISPAATEIAENSVLAGAVEGKTSFGKPGYGGPCPPSGTHRYFFKIYALDKRLDLRAEANVKALGKEIKGHVVEEAELIGLYARARN